MTAAAYTGSIEKPSPDVPAERRRVIRRPDGSTLATGFAWGSGGSGPAQVALAILADCTGDDELAQRLCQAFKWGVIQQLPMDEGWALTVDEVRRWVGRHAPRATTQVPWQRQDQSGDSAVDIH